MTSAAPQRQKRLSGSKVEESRGPLVTLTLPGRPIVLKNSKRIMGRGSRKIVLPSARYAQWEKQAIAACNRKPSIALLDMPLIAHYRFYFKDRQAEADVSNLCEGPGDVMQKARVIANDKLILKIVAEKFFGHEPRTEIELYKYEVSA